MPKNRKCALGTPVDATRGATGKDEIEHDDLVGKIRKTDGIALDVGEFERWRGRYIDC